MATVLSGTMDAGQAQTFEGFYEEWFDRVHGYARHRTGSAVKADEIVSETFTRALRSWRSFDPLKGDRRTWLFSIAFRAVADHFRTESRKRWMTLGLYRPAAEPGPAEGLEETEEQKALGAALGKLAEREREIVSLKFFGGMTNRAIARLTGLTESNVAVILFRSVRRMRQELTDHE